MRQAIAHSSFFFFFLMIRRPPRPTLFPYPPLFRSSCPPCPAPHRPRLPRPRAARRRSSSFCTAASALATLLDHVRGSRHEDEDDQSHDASQLWRRPDRKSTRLNSSHGYISYAVFCL